jgi:integrating conjugative element membrane protein (TIGR03747 family)
MSSNKQHNLKSSVVGSILRMLLQLISWLMISWLVAQLILIIEIVWCGHSLIALTSTALLTHEITDFSQQAVNSSVWQIFVEPVLMLIHYLQNIANNIPSITVFGLETKNYVVQTLIQAVYPALADYAHAAINMTQIVLLRITNVFLFAPLILLLGLLGLINGLVVRYLRRINGGRESSLIYHYAKLSIKAFLFWGSLLYVVMPFPLTPAYFLLPCVVASSFAIYLAIKFFKKYA